MIPDREFLEQLARMMSRLLARNPGDHTAAVVLREIAEHVATYPTPPAKAAESKGAA